MEKLGLVFFKHIRLAFWKDFLVSARNTKIEASLGAKYDVLLGYTYMYKKSSRKYPGYIVLGNEKTAGKKIMILGGSTSDVGLWEYFIKSWPEFLFDKLEDVCVFCGGISGYDSRQELLKLLRDGRQISPDLVISYSGFNDMLIRHADGYPYARGKGKPKETEVWGIRTNGTKSEGWIESENLMQVIASAFGADFIGMFQPILLNRDKKYMTFEEKVIYKEGLLEMSWDEYEKYQDEVKEKILTIPYIYDMTGTFYRESRGIFRDPCHLREEGNKILADAVYELILKSKTL